MLAVVEVIVLTALEVVHSNQLSFHGIVKVLALHKNVGAENDLILFRDESSLHESIAGLQADVHQRLKSKITCDQTIRYCAVEFVSLECIKVTLCFEFGPTGVLIEHYNDDSQVRKNK